MKDEIRWEGRETRDAIEEVGGAILNELDVVKEIIKSELRVTVQRIGHSIRDALTDELVDNALARIRRYHEALDNLFYYVGKDNADEVRRTHHAIQNLREKLQTKAHDVQVKLDESNLPMFHNAISDQNSEEFNKYSRLFNVWVAIHSAVIQVDRMIGA